MRAEGGRMNECDKYEIELYNDGMDVLKEHLDQSCFLVMKSREENKGNFKYIDEEDFKRERKLAEILTRMLSRLDLKIRDEMNKQGSCDKICCECEYRRYNVYPKRALGYWSKEERKEGWYCQVECECK